MTIAVWIIAIILLVVFIDHYGWEILGCLALALVYIGLPLLIIGGFYYYLDSRDNSEILVEEYYRNVNEYQAKKIETQEEYEQKVKENSPWAYECAQKARQFYNSNASLGEIEDTEVYQRCKAEHNKSIQ